MKFVTVILFILTVGLTAFAQAAPETSVSGFALLQSEDAAKTALAGYSPRFDNERGAPQYFFYNEYGNQVMSLTALSRDRPFLITAIEVFGVDATYTKKHFQLKSIGYFTSESGFFLGARPSATSLIFAVPNTTTPNDVIKKKGAPQSDAKSGKTRTLRYEPTAEKKIGAATFTRYTAEYEFYKGRLKRFIIAAEEAKS